MNKNKIMNNLDKQYTALLQDILDNGVIRKKKSLTAFERENYFATLKNYSEQERLEMNPNASDEEVHEIMDELKVPKNEYSILFNDKIFVYYE